MHKKIVSLTIISFVLISLFPIVYSSGWLEGWDYRIELKLNYNDVDEILNDFPILVHLSNSSGINNQDLTSIFDEIGDNYNNTAYVYNNERLFFEVEYWNIMENLAEVWLKVPEVNNITYTIIYLYYDIYMDGSEYNNPYEVWNSFVMVQHMNDYNSTTILDSTSNDNDGVKKDVNEPIETDGQIGKAQDCDGENDDITLNDFQNSYTPITISVWIYINESPTSWCAIFYKGSEDVDGIQFNAGTTQVRFHLTMTDASERTTDWTDALSLETWINIVATYDSLTVTLYVDKILAETETYVGYKEIRESATDWVIGRQKAMAGRWFNGIIDEAQFSSDNRSGAWIGASYETQNDNFIIYGEISSMLSGDIMLIAIIALMVALFSFLLVIIHRGKLT